MKKDFDFDDIGKQTPYRTPDGFFENMQRKVMESTDVKQQRKPHLKLIVSAVLAMAAALAGLLFVPSLRQMDATMSPSASDVLAIEKNHVVTDPAENWIKELSDEELEELVHFTENDVFLN